MSADGGHDVRRGLAFLLVTMTAWGLNWPVMKYLLSEMTPFALRGISGFAGAALAFVVAARLGERLAPPLGQWPRLVVYSLLNLTSWAGLSIIALTWLPASEAAIVSYTTPLWTALLAWALLGEKPTLLRAGGLALGLAGVAVLALGRPIVASADQLPGITFMVGACILFSLGTVLTKRRPLQLPPLAAIAWQIGLGTVPLAVLAVAFEPPRAPALSAGGWACLTYLSFVAICLAYVCWFRALRLVPATTASMGMLLVPIIGVVSSAIALGEPLSVRQLTALAMTLGGVIAATKA
jgi:drug/metabolite transporter (DMT)-like permease